MRPRGEDEGGRETGRREERFYLGIFILNQPQ